MKSGFNNESSPIFLTSFLLMAGILTGSIAMASPSGKGDRSPVDLDWTMVLVLTGFFILIYTINRLILRPILDEIDERSQRLLLPKKEAEALRVQAENIKSEYDKQIKAIKEKAVIQRERLSQEGKTVEKQVLEEVREATALEIEAFKKELSVEITSLQSVLEKDAKEIAAVIVQKMVPH